MTTILPDAADAVRARIRKRWEKRRAETFSGTAAFSRWRFDGRYAYRESGYGRMSESEVEAVEPHHRHLVMIWEESPR